MYSCTSYAWVCRMRRGIIYSRAVKWSINNNRSRCVLWLAAVHSDSNLTHKHYTLHESIYIQQKFSKKKFFYFFYLTFELCWITLSDHSPATVHPSKEIYHSLPAQEVDRTIKNAALIRTLRALPARWMNERAVNGTRGIESELSNSTSHITKHDRASSARTSFIKIKTHSNSKPDLTTGWFVHSSNGLFFLCCMWWHDLSNQSSIRWKIFLCCWWCVGCVVISKRK